MIIMNGKLQNELVQMATEDMITRQRLVKNGELFDKNNNYHPEMKKVHEKNNARIREIIYEYGWPGISLVG